MKIEKDKLSKVVHIGIRELHHELMGIGLFLGHEHMDVLEDHINCHLNEILKHAFMEDKAKELSIVFHTMPRLSIEELTEKLNKSEEANEKLKKELTLWKDIAESQQRFIDHWRSQELNRQTEKTST